MMSVLTSATSELFPINPLGLQIPSDQLGWSEHVGPGFAASPMRQENPKKQSIRTQNLAKTLGMAKWLTTGSGFCLWLPGFQS